MKVFRWMMTAALLGGVAAQAEVPELTALVPEAKDYELIGKLNPLTWEKNGYIIDRAEALSGDLRRIGYLLKLTAKDGKESWVFTSMDAFTAKPAGSKRAMSKSGAATTAAGMQRTSPAQPTSATSATR